MTTLGNPFSTATGWQITSGPGAGTGGTFGPPLFPNSFDSAWSAMEANSGLSTGGVIQPNTIQGQTILPQNPGGYDVSIGEPSGVVNSLDWSPFGNTTASNLGTANAASPSDTGTVPSGSATGGTNTQPATAPPPSKTALQAVGSYFSRGVVIIVGLIFIAVGLSLFGRGGGRIVQEAKKVTPDVDKLPVKNDVPTNRAELKEFLAKGGKVSAAK